MGAALRLRRARVDSFVECKRVSCSPGRAIVCMHGIVLLCQFVLRRFSLTI